MSDGAAAKFESCIWSTTLVINDSLQENVTPAPEQCPFFAIRLTFLSITTVFCILGLTVFANIFIFEYRPGFTSVAQQHGINTFVLAIALIIGPIVVLIIQIMHCGVEGSPSVIAAVKLPKGHSELQPAEFPKSKEIAGTV